MVPGTQQGSFGEGGKSHSAITEARSKNPSFSQYPNPSFSSRGEQLLTLWPNRRLGLATQATRGGNEAA